MASERTCGECRDCRHWKPKPRVTSWDYCSHPKVNSPVPDGFGCVLFEAKPAPRVAAFLALDREYLTLEDLQVAVKAHPDRVRDISRFTHVYSGAGINYLFRYEEETNR